MILRLLRIFILCLYLVKNRLDFKITIEPSEMTLTLFDIPIADETKATLYEFIPEFYGKNGKLYWTWSYK